MPLDPNQLADDVIAIIDSAIGPVVERLAAANQTIADLERRLADATAGLAAMGERVMVIESAAAVPGPAGPAGANGPAGRDGFGFDDLTVDYDGERTLTLRFVAGDRVKAFPIVLPWPVYRGTFKAGADYNRGDVVTDRGSAWHANTATRFRPGDSPDWQMMVRRGDRGHDAKPAKDQAA